MNIFVAIILFFSELASGESLLNSLPPMTPREAYVQGCWDAYWAAIAAANKAYHESPNDPDREMRKQARYEAAKRAKRECYANGVPPVNPYAPEPRPKRKPGVRFGEMTELE